MVPSKDNDYTYYKPSASTDPNFAPFYFLYNSDSKYHYEGPYYLSIRPIKIIERNFKEEDVGMIERSDVPRLSRPQSLYLAKS